MSTLEDTDKVTVLTVQMVYENEFFGRKDTDFTYDLIEKAGGICLDEAFGKQSIENLIALNPDVLVIINRTDSPAQEKIDALKSNPSLSEVNAVKNDRLFRWITSTSMAVTMKPSMRSNPWHVVFTRNSSLNDRKE